MPKHKSAKIESLAACEAYHKMVATAKPKPEERIVLPIESEAIKMACDIGEVFRIQRDFWKRLGAPKGDVRVKA